MRIEVASKRFGPAEVLRDIVLAIDTGERLALTGPSGVGKSTLVRIVAGLDTDFTGRVDGVGRIAMVFQEPTLLPWRTALHNITLPTRCTPQKARALLAEVGLEGRDAAYPRQLSLGQQRRLALARAFAADPQLFVMDEAFASLDEATAERMRTLTDTLLRVRDITAIIVTHAPEEAVALCDRVIGLAGTPGRVTFDERIPPAADAGEAARQAQTLRALMRDTAPQD